MDTFLTCIKDFKQLIHIDEIILDSFIVSTVYPESYQEFTPTLHLMATRNGLYTLDDLVALLLWEEYTWITHNILIANDQEMSSRNARSVWLAARVEQQS